jgi:DNA primase
MMARFGQDKIEEVRTRADIVEVIGTQVRLRRAGRNFVGLCPFHDEKTPSFSVNAERGFFHCFGCGAGGTVYDFVMRVEGLTFPEALQSLARRYGIALPPRLGDEGGAPPNEREAFLRANQTAAEFYVHVLWNTQDGGLARDYLKGRGITLETARAFMIGFAPARPANLAAALHKRGLIEAGLKLGLVKKDASGTSYDMFRARLMFPIRDVQGRVIAFGGRVLDQRLPKYINSAESPLYSKARAIYGVFEARQAIAKADRAIVVEGYIDAIAIWQAGFKEAVASLGTSLTVEQLRLISRYTRNVIACFDGDAAGRKASLRALEIFLQAGLLGRGAFIPQGYDPDTLVREHGAQAFAELVDSAALLVDFFLEDESGRVRGPNGPLDQRAEAAKRIAEKLRLVSDEFQFNLLARKAAGLLGVGEEVLRREARRNAPAPSRHTTARPQPARNQPRPSATAQAELGLVAIALRYPELRAQISEQAAREGFEDRTLAELMVEVCGSEASPATLEVAIVNRLGEDQRGQLSAMVVGPLLEDLEKARRLATDYAASLAKSRGRREVEDGLRRVASSGGSQEATAAAQNVIELRRRSGGEA